MIDVKKILERVDLLTASLVAVMTFLTVGVGVGMAWPRNPDACRQEIRAPSYGGIGGNRGDPRVVSRAPFRCDSSPQDFVVAWVTDSSPITHVPDPDDVQKYTFGELIQHKIARYRREIGAREVVFRMYMQSSSKAIDKYMLSQHAFSQRPDMLIYGVNPTFDFTSVSMMGDSMTPGSLATYGDARAWRWSFLLATPADLVQGALMRLLPVIRDRFDIGTYLLGGFRRRLDFFQFDSCRPASGPVVGDTNGWVLGDLDYDETRVSKMEAIHLRAMRRMDLTPRSWGKQILIDLVTRARGCGIPTLIYIIPLKIDAIERDPVVSARFSDFEDWFAGFAAAESHGNVRIIPMTPTRTLTGLLNYDISHLVEADPFVRFMSDEISRNATASR